MLAIICTATVTLFDLLECHEKCSEHNFRAGYSRQTPFKTHALLNDGLDKILCRMYKSLIFATLSKVSIIFGK